MQETSRTQCGWAYPKGPTVGRCNMMRTTPVVRQGPNWRDGDINSPSKDLTNCCSCLKEMQRLKWSRDWRNGIPDTSLTLDPTHGWASNPDIITDGMLYLQSGAWHGCPLRSSTSNWPRQMQTLTVNHWTEVGSSYSRIRGRIEGAEGDGNPIGTPTVSTKLYHWELPETKQPTKEHT